MNKFTKWNVKGFQWEEKNKELNENKKTKCNIRKIVILGTDMQWKAAKELQKKYYSINAFLTPYKPEKLRVIKLN